jgi:hypothetical protein
MVGKRNTFSWPTNKLELVRTVVTDWFYNGIAVTIWTTENRVFWKNFYNKASLNDSQISIIGAEYKTLNKACNLNNRNQKQKAGSFKHLDNARIGLWTWST